MQDPTYAMIFSVLNKAINPTITGLALRLAFHDAGTWNAKTRPVGGCVHLHWLHESCFAVLSMWPLLSILSCWCIAAMSSACSLLAFSVS